MSDSVGNRLLFRTWMLSDHKHDPKHLGKEVIRVRETKPHALSHANTLANEAQTEFDVRERESRAAFDALDATDREILRLHLVRTAAREQRVPFPASKREELEAAGWIFVSKTKSGHVLMVKSFVGQMTYAEIAARVQLSVRTVQRRLSAMDPAMVQFAEMRGWT